MTRLSVFLRQTAKSCSTRIKSKILPPASAFIPQKDFAKNAAQYYVLNEVEKDVFRTNKLYSTRQGTPKSAYGGLIFSQSMAAAENTVPNELKPHAIHSFFILNGHIDYKVTRLRDGKSFCTRRVDAVQNGKIAFCLEISFHRDEPDSVVHQSKMPECAPWSALANTKEAVPWFKKLVESEKTELPKGAKDALHGYDTFALSKEDLFEGSFCKLFEHNLIKTLLTRRSLLFQLRPCDLYRVYGLTEEPSTTFCNWFRASGELSDDDKLHRYLLAYMTDSVMPLAVSRPHFINKDFTPSMMFSLDHNIWIHDPAVRADQWLLYELTTTWGGKSRGFNKAQLFTEDGKLVLTSVQELLIRSRGDPSVI